LHRLVDVLPEEPIVAVINDRDDHHWSLFYSLVCPYRILSGHSGPWPCCSTRWMA
jgi:hypothetical protein